MGKVVALGEVMLRLSTEQGIRINQSKSFLAHYGGGEANVAVSLAYMGHQSKYASKVPNNMLGNAVLQNLRAAGVDTSAILIRGTASGHLLFRSRRR